MSQNSHGLMTVQVLHSGDAWHFLLFTEGRIGPQFIAGRGWWSGMQLGRCTIVPNSFESFHGPGGLSVRCSLQGITGKNDGNEDSKSHGWGPLELTGCTLPFTTSTTGQLLLSRREKSGSEWLRLYTIGGSDGDWTIGFNPNGAERPQRFSDLSFVRNGAVYTASGQRHEASFGELLDCRSGEPYAM